MPNDPSLEDQLKHTVDRTLAIGGGPDTTACLFELAGAIHYEQREPGHVRSALDILHRTGRENKDLRALSRVALKPLISPYSPFGADTQAIMGEAMCHMAGDDIDYLIATYDNSVPASRQPLTAEAADPKLGNILLRYVLGTISTGSEILDTVMGDMRSVLTGEIGHVLAAKDWLDTVYDYQLPILVRCRERNYSGQTLTEPGAYDGTRLGRALQPRTRGDGPGIAAAYETYE